MTIGELIESFQAGYAEFKEAAAAAWYEAKTAILNVEVSQVLIGLVVIAGVIGLLNVISNLEEWSRNRKLARRTFEYFWIEGRDGIFENTGVSKQLIGGDLVGGILIAPNGERFPAVQFPIKKVLPLSNDEAEKYLNELPAWDGQ
jgi:hypothetical protein